MKKCAYLGMVIPFMVSIPEDIRYPTKEDLRVIEPGKPAPRTITGTRASIRTEPKIQRNEPCLCGSGKKFKHCCIKF